MIFKKKEQYFQYKAKFSRISGYGFCDEAQLLEEYKVIKQFFEDLDSTKEVTFTPFYPVVDPYHSNPNVQEDIEYIEISIYSKLSLENILNNMINCKNKFSIDIEEIYDTLNLARYYTGHERRGINFDKDDFFKYFIILSFFILFIQLSKAFITGYDPFSVKLSDVSKMPSKSTAFSHYIRDEDNNTKVIVFVHGVTGNSTSTWTNERTGAYWPSLIKDDKDFSQANIYVVQYPSPAIGKSLSVNELSENMRLRFEANKLLKHTEIIFLSHSMGGLVTRDFLQKYRNYADKVNFSYFFATPSAGSDYAVLANLISNNPQIENLYPLKSDSYLGNLERNWQAADLDIESYCAYERLDTYGLTIVDQKSASHLCTKPLDPILTNHIDIVKPADHNSDIYISFKNAYIQNLKINSH